jgi:hypothetical protein
MMALTSAGAAFRHDVSAWMSGEMFMIEALAFAVVAVALALPLLVMATIGPLDEKFG